MNTLAPLLDALAARLRTPLTLDQGVCALYDAQQREALVLECPEHSDSIILHCDLRLARPVDAITLLEMNFRADVLGGCWLAQDPEGCIRLCALCAQELLDERRFCDWVLGFMAQVSEVRDRLQPVRSARQA
ncbi:MULTISPECIES: type III secretion system chaperone [Pseudomonas]|uniref:type III secretion system chaperone n=1 Tax=Pseudomonas TaxID=286 RepID=UPI00235DDDDE|nr:MULTISPECIES: type III secretion system chaperone [unclassified Pseudomonas]